MTCVRAIIYVCVEDYATNVFNVDTCNKLAINKL